MRTPALVLVAVGLLVAPAGLSLHGDPTPLVQGFVLLVNGELASGLVAAPDTAEWPRALGIVAIMHGYGHKAASHDKHLQEIAQAGYVAFAMDFRGEGMPLRAGADDTMAALDAMKAAHSDASENVILYSVSMGTASAAMVLAERDDIDLWVDNEGLAMLAETWAEGTAVSPAIAFGAKARADIEAETGGTPADVPAAYVERSAALRASEFTIQGAVLTHGLNDGLVPYDQGREMAAALRAAGIPTDFWTVATCAPGSEGTTITGHATLGGQGVCGHGTESNDAHTLTALSFSLLHAMLGGDRPSNAEHVVDGTLGTLP